MPTFALLPSRGVIALSGEEASTFLNGLITANVEDVDQGTPAYGALLTPQGKILFDFFIQRDGERYLVDCSVSQKPDLIKRLTFYKLRAKVDIADLSDTMGVAAGWDGAELPGLAYADPRSEQAGARTVADLEDFKGLEDAGEAAYEAHRIALGLADSDRDIGSGELFPHEANFDQVGGVHFTKGCYVGQEVVSRMKHKAKVRKRIVIAHGESGTLASGSEITTDGKVSGTVLSTQGAEGLALIRLDRLEDAYANAGEISAGDARLTFRKPEWATFDMPEAPN
ncbi:MAG: folate-binding protein [Pseudomonadota bacterium]